jgi:hypothetical protein
MSGAKSAYYAGMVGDLRNRIAGGKFFFTLTLADRR